MAVVHEDKLSAVLSEFARTLVTDFPIQGILDHLVERIVDILPVTAAGVTLISEGTAPRYVAASNSDALRFERLQSDIGQGPCLAAFITGEAVSVPDLHQTASFPRFAPSALTAGLAAVFAFPLRHGDGCLGALDLYRGTPGPLSAADLATAQTLADVAAAYLLNAQARDDARATSDHFYHSALHDPLTGLPNRLMLQQRLEHVAQRSLRSHATAAILFADLDRFKKVNDTHGHQVGDALLLAVARRLSALVRPGDTMARVSGDEFVFLCEDLASPDDVVLLARRIDEAFARPFIVAGLELSASASVGIAFAGPGDSISEELVAQADRAMYRAKRRGGGHHVIDLREAVHAADGHDFEGDLRRAFARDELDVAYQPIVTTGDGFLTGVEALLRWTHPTRGAVPAMSMIGVAEQSTLIDEVGAWVLERACRDRGRWLRSHPAVPIDLAVNVSARQLMAQDFPSLVEAVLDVTAMDPGALVLEMTEDVFVEDLDRAAAVLARLRGLGIRLALDDFGTGYSSLSYLRRLPVHIVKIDQSFVADVDRVPLGGPVLAAVTNLAHVLGLSVIAEGVETSSQAEEVSAVGCQWAQGYFYARPMPAAAIAALLERGRTRPPRLPEHGDPGGAGAAVDDASSEASLPDAPAAA